MDGLTKYLWEMLCPVSCTVWITCHRNGSFMTQLDVTNQSTGSGDSQNDSQNYTKPNCINNQIQSKIERSVKLFRMGGVAIMAGALLLNVPWILLITQARDTIKPRWVVGQ